MKLIILTTALLVTGLVYAHQNDGKKDNVVSRDNDTKAPCSIAGTEVNRYKNGRSGDKQKSTGGSDRQAGKPVITITRLPPGRQEDRRPTSAHRAINNSMPHYGTN